LTVKANDVTILAGETPQYTSTITGLLNGDSPTAEPEYSITPLYNGLAGIYTITPSDLQFASPGNYEITYLDGALYVNPGANSAKAIRPILRCVEEVKGNPNYTLRARFEYQNDNASGVFIPIGPENMIVAEGSYSGTQPELFLAGGGSFEILFNGEKLTWTVISYDKGKKTSIGSTASSTSTRCKKGGGNSAGREIADEGEMITLSAEEPLIGYPNPATESVSVTLSDASSEPSSTDIIVTDQMGRSYRLSTTWVEDKKLLTLDISSLQKGLYIIKVRFPEDIRIVKVFKQ
jgi:hypothetical protein